eukprot:117204-Heterocapsa_arctica.AAC.1
MAKVLLLNVCPLPRRLDRRASRPGRLAAVSRSRPCSRVPSTCNIMPQYGGLCRNLTLNAVATYWHPGGSDR